MTKKYKDWVIGPFRYLIEYLRESARYVEVAEFGIRNTGHLAIAEEIFQELDRITDPDKPIPDERLKELEALRKRAEMAGEEIAYGIPMLHAYLAVGMWSAIEATVDDFVLAWLCNVPEALDSDELQSIKIPLVEFEKSTREERMEVLLYEYKRVVRAPVRLGLERFESLLKPLGLSGQVDKQIRETLYELSQVRNVIVHRASRVDKKFLDSCPWFNLNVNDKLRLSHMHTKAYTEAGSGYIKNLLLRIRAHEQGTEEE